MKSILKAKNSEKTSQKREPVPVMHLAPREIDKLLLHNVGFLAQKRLARGLRLNLQEATALIASVLCELIRDGNHTVAELMDLGKRFLGRRHVLSDVPALLHEVQVEGTFPDGSKLVSVHQPVSSDDGDMSWALYGSFLPIPTQDKFPDPGPCPSPEDTPGAMVVKPGKLRLVPDRQRFKVKVTNAGDRPIQIGSHYHFIETNASLSFDRELAYGRRLDIAAGTAVRFEPGDTKTVSLVDIGGKCVITGGNNLATGVVDVSKLPAIMSRVKAQGFRHVKQTGTPVPAAPYEVDRHVYADMFGPTVGDRLRLGDSALWLEIEKDHTVYGDECKFGGGKVLREGMGQATGVSDAESLDLIITNCVIVDYTGIYKADIGIKKGMIHAIGKGGNPDVMDGVCPDMIVGVTTEVCAGEGLILTAGAIDAHIHYICPGICDEALASGITTLIGGGTGPNTGTKATTCTPGDFHIKMMLQATDGIPLNFGFTGKGNSSDKEALGSQIRAGAIGLKLHEDWGTTNAAIDTCLELCEEMDVQATIHTDTLNESGYVESSIKAYKNRTIHAYHCEGAGGGHSPDIIKVVGEACVLPSSTNPTRPYTKNTLDEHIDMLMVCHHLDNSIPEDVAFAESRIRGETIAAEDVLHDLGAISIISSDSQAMGRVGEVISRTWHTAHKMKIERGFLPDDEKGTKRSAQDETSVRTDDNFRIRRYIAKYTINPAIAHGVGHIIGSIEVGKLADLVLWQPSRFGTKPELVIKGGVIVTAQMGDANASIPTTQPVISRQMFGSNASVAGTTSLAFVSGSSFDRVTATYGLKKRVTPVKKCRGVTKNDMKLNRYLPKMKVDPEKYEVKADGRICTAPAAETLPLTQGSYIF